MATMPRTNTDAIRRAIIRDFGLTGEGRKLPASFETLGHVVDGTWVVRVLSSADAKRKSPKSCRPHRLMIWDHHCERWVFAGKYDQHARAVHSKQQENNSYETR